LQQTDVRPYNKAINRTNNSWLFAPASPILANNYLPIIGALGISLIIGSRSNMLISNSESNHRDELIKLIRWSDERFVIASPFLAENMEGFLNSFDFSSIKKIDLITTFKPSNPEQVTKPFQLKAFFLHFKNKYKNIDVKIHIDNQLHGKMYFSLGSSPKKMILTSGNFTMNGLCNNHEWGILTSDENLIEQALHELFNGIEYPEVSYLQIERSCQFAEVYLGNNPEWSKKPEIFSNILESTYSDKDTQNTNPQYFLKPIGHKENPVTIDSQRDFSGLHQYLHFSKKKPKGVKKGDIIITTAVGVGSLLSFFRVTGGLQHVSEDDIKDNDWAERWPWFLEGKNNSPKFGSEWWKHNIRRQDLLSDFRELYPQTPVTYAGGFTLGTINMGNDKVKITKEFGDYLISQIEKCESVAE
jgi:hypothetical protein